MPRFLIVVPHEENETSCIQAVKVFHETGSHWLTNADWGCTDGDHTAWIILEAETKEEASHVVPPMFRHDAHIVALNKFSKEEMEEMLKSHGM